MDRIVIMVNISLFLSSAGTSLIFCFSGYFNQCQGVGLQQADNVISLSGTASTSVSAPTSSTDDSASISTSSFTSTSTTTSSISTYSSDSSDSSISLNVSLVTSYTSSSFTPTSTSTLPNPTLISSAKSLGVKFVGMIFLGAVVGIVL